MYMLAVNPLRYINILWHDSKPFDMYIRISTLYGLMYMLAANPLRYINILWHDSKPFEVWLQWHRRTFISYFTM